MSTKPKSLGEYNLKVGDTINWYDKKDRSARVTKVAGKFITFDTGKTVHKSDYPSNHHFSRFSVGKGRTAPAAKSIATKTVTSTAKPVVKSSATVKSSAIDERIKGLQSKFTSLITDLKEVVSSKK